MVWLCTRPDQIYQLDIEPIERFLDKLYGRVRAGASRCFDMVVVDGYIGMSDRQWVLL